MMDHFGYCNTIMEAPSKAPTDFGFSPTVVYCEGDELLIDVVKSYPFLYNKTKKEYKDVNIKRNAWSEIASILQTSEKEVENRWQRMRERYSKERKIRERPASRSGLQSQESSKWPFYNKLKFLNEHIKRRNTFTNVKKITDENRPEKFKETETNISKTTFRPITPSTPSTGNHSHSSSASTPIDGVHTIPVDSDVEFDQLDPSPLPSEKGSGNFKKWKTDPLITELSVLSSSLCSFFQRKTSSINKNETTTPEENFGQLIVSELQKMPDNIQRDRKMRIMNILYEPY